MVNYYCLVLLWRILKSGRNASEWHPPSLGIFSDSYMSWDQKCYKTPHRDWYRRRDLVLGDFACTLIIQLIVAQMSKQLYDCLIVGAGPAGLAVATGLARQQHTAVVFDSGLYRNQLAKHMHNVLGWDHRDPAEFRAKVRQDLLDRYTTIEFHNMAVKELRKLDNGHFEAVDNEGDVFTGRKVCLATGVKDVMPDIDGYADCWARGM